MLLIAVFFVLALSFLDGLNKPKVLNSMKYLSYENGVKTKRR